jgi:hypothetical protein
MNRPPPIQVYAVGPGSTTSSSNTSTNTTGIPGMPSFILTPEWSLDELTTFQHLLLISPPNESLVMKSLRIASVLPRKSARDVAKRIVEQTYR